MQNGKPWAEKKWYDGEWSCSKCGAKITRLPFNPDPNRLDSLLCKDCHKAKMDSMRDR